MEHEVSGTCILKKRNLLFKEVPPFQNPDLSMTQEEEIKKFYAAFESKVNDTIESMELAELRASNDSYQDLNLKLQNFQNSLWGLVVFCRNATYFYIAPSENYISFFVRKSTGEDGPVEQYTCLSDRNIVWSLPKNSFLKYLLPERSRTIFAKWTGSQGNECNAELVFNKKAYPVFEKLTSR